MTSETYKKDVMRWVNTGYSISFRCRTAVVVDGAGILFFTISADANWFLIVYIFYPIAGMWKRLVACQPFCPTCLRNFLRAVADSKWGRLVTSARACVRIFPATADSRPGGWVWLQPLSKAHGAMLSWWFQRACDRGINCYLEFFPLEM